MGFGAGGVEVEGAVVGVAEPLDGDSSRGRDGGGGGCFGGEGSSIFGPGATPDTSPRQCGGGGSVGTSLCSIF